MKKIVKQRSGGPGLRPPGRSIRKTVRIDTRDLVDLKSPNGEGTLPLLVSPKMSGVDIISWAKDNRPLIDEKLARHGAIAFRGFSLGSVDQFREFAEIVIDELNDSPEHTPIEREKTVLRPGFYPSDDRLTWHNEKAYAPVWPGKIMLGCEAPAPEGGVSLIIDSRRMVKEMDPEIRARFRELGVMYSRNYSQNIGRSWQTIFDTDSKADVEARCRRDGVAFEWRPEDGLRTRKVLPAISVHPETGEEVWFNQVQHWHSTSLEPNTRASMRELLGEEGMPRNSFFGDGSIIDDEIIFELNTLSEKIDAGFLLERGDAILIDNMLAAHGRTAYRGERKIMVALGDPGSYQALASTTTVRG